MGDDNKSTYSYKLANLRAVAILLVVLGHSIILYDPAWSIYMPPSEYPPFRILKQIINLIQMPLYFSISGYLYYWTVTKRSFWQITKGKIIRILLPFIIVLLFYSNPIKYLIGVPGYKCVPQLLIDNILFQNLGHLWFLPVLFFLFLITYFIFRYLTSTKLIIICLILLFCLAYISYFLPSIFRIKSTAYYLLFFYFGGLLNRWKSLEKSSTRIKKLTAVALIVLIFVGYFSPSIYRIPISLLMIPCSYILIPDRNIISLGFIASLSFGIYLFHSPLIYLTYKHFNFLNPWIVLFINFILFGLIASLITYVIRKIRPLSFIIGE